MDKITKIFSRYLIVLFVGILGGFFYSFLHQITFSTLAFILNAKIVGEYLLVNAKLIELIPACLAGSAFFLLFFLAMSVPNLKIKKRIYLILFSFAILFVANILRIILLIPLIDTPSFETIHWILWHILSTAFVILIWVAAIILFKIKSLPVYDDIKSISKSIKSGKNPQRKNKNQNSRKKNASRNSKKTS